MKRRFLILTLAVALILSAVGCGSSTPAAESSSEGEGGYADFQTAIMLPGIEGENAIFQMIASGIRDACAELGAPEPKVVEGGDQWTSYGKYLTSLAAAGIYDVIFTTTDVMRYCVNDTVKAYPDQKIVLVDADLVGYESKFDGGKIPANVWGISFDMYQLGYLGGHFCALVTQSSMERANPDLKVGLVTTDIYDAWDVDLKTGFTNGVKDVNPDIEIISSVIGDWVDPAKGAAVTRALIAQGVDIVYYTSGASAYGCVTEAEAQNCYAIPHDNNSISLAPGTIIGASLVQGYDAAYAAAKGAIEGTLEYGTGRRAGVAESVIAFTTDDPVYLETVPEDIRAAMDAAIQGLTDGTIDARRPIA